MSPTLKIILVGSIALNLLFAGAVIGRIVAGPPMRPGPMPGNLGWMVRHLDEDTRKTLRPEFENHMRKTLPLRREMRQAQDAFEEALSKPEIDEPALDAALARLRTSSDAFQQEMHEQMVRIIKKLGPEDRQRVIQFLRTQRERHHRGPNRGDPPREAPPE